MFGWFTDILSEFLYFLPLGMQIWFGILFASMVALAVWRILV